MLITRIELENIKSYRRLGVDFRRGTTAISGANGAGKTTLVEAIGYALFDFLPYNQGQFVREGEKYGKIVVHLVGGDDRPYEVERRIGSGAHWIIYDREADMRIEQKADVSDKLHEIFGIDRERPLKSLFRDALGVPQGTFTSVFLLPASDRQKTFNALLQIDDFKTAFDALLEARKVYDEQIQQQKDEIQRLEFETRDLESWRADLKKARRDEEDMTAQNALATRRQSELRARIELLKQRRDQLNAAKGRYQQLQTLANTAQQLLAGSERSLSDAQAAQHALETSRLDYERYKQAEELLGELRKREQLRNRLRQEQSEQQRALATVQANIRHTRARLDDVATARQRVVDLFPLVEQQHALELRRDQLMQQVTQYETLLKEIKRLSTHETAQQQQLAKLQRQIAAIEPLRPLAEHLVERLERYTLLSAKAGERGSKRLAYEEKNALLSKKLDDKEQLAGKLRKADDFLAWIEEHRQEAEEMPALQSQLEDYSRQHARLEGNIDGYKKSRRLSLGGQCPLLHEPCQNIKARGLVSLEFYFDGEIRREQAELAAIAGQVSVIEKRVAQVKKPAEELSKIGYYTEKRDGFAEQLRQTAQDITRLEREVGALRDDLEALSSIDQQIAQAKAEHEESKQADAQVRTLESLYTQEQQTQALLEQIATDLQERNRQAGELRESADMLKQVQQDLDALNDPRSLSKAQQEIIKQEAAHQQALQGEERERLELEQRLQALQEQLAQFAELDAHIGEQEAIKQVCAPGYNTYLANQETARQLPERQRAYQLALDEAQQAARDVQEAEQAFLAAQQVFNEQELTDAESESNALHAELSRLAEAMSNLQRDIRRLEQRIEQAETLLKQLEAAQQEKRVLEDLGRMLEQFRKLIRDAAPHVLKAMLTDISGEANRIFGEIMGDRSAQLTWENDYEIVLRRQGVSRAFAQLSGGEQMSAALAVRLALLKKLSTLNIAFFDEPTQNMDELRRANLAEQIRRVRGFDQLFVISHDDTFEQSLDSLVRLRKKEGETRLISDEEVSVAAEEQVTIHAS